MRKRNEGKKRLRAINKPNNKCDPTHSTMVIYMHAYCALVMMKRRQTEEEIERLHRTKALKVLVLHTTPKLACTYKLFVNPVTITVKMSTDNYSTVFIINVL